jgi:excisionase family DNA binding protein
MCPSCMRAFDLQPILVSKKEAARLLGVCLRTVDCLIERGDLRHKRIGRRVLLQYEELQKFVDSDVKDATNSRHHQHH